MAETLIATDERLREISSTLVRERLRAGALQEFPGLLPATLEEAYRVQALSREAWPDDVIGWKVGGIPPIHREALGEDFLSGPIFAQRFVLAAAETESPMPIFANGFAAIEPEFVLKLGQSPNSDRLFIGAEIASSPIVDINGVGPIAVVCDFGNNNGILLGDEIPHWRQLGGEEVVVTSRIDGEIVGQRTVADVPALVSTSRDFLTEHARQQGIELPAGTLISTGAITGVHDAQLGARSTLDFGRFGSLALRLVEAQPQQ
ncbi:MAG: 2-keto-4-pentenoate hydratase [Pseudomonadota bacterium]